MDDLVKTEHERQIADAKRRMEQEQNKVQDKLNEHHAKKSQAEQELETLKFYQLGRKKELREAIENVAAQIEKRAQEKAEWEAWFLEEQKNIESKLPAYREEIKKTVYQQNPIPKKPAATDKPKLFKSKNSALDLKAAIENMGMATKEELKAIGGHGYDKDLEALKTRGLVEAVAVRGEYYYLALSDQELRDLGGEVLETPEEARLRRIAASCSAEEQEILDCLRNAEGPLTCAKIQCEIDNPALSTPKISMLLKHMVGEGLVIKTVDRRVDYYQIADGNSCRTVSTDAAAQESVAEKNNQQKVMILECLMRTGRWMTCANIQKSIEEELSTPKISALVNQLVGDGLVEKKTENRVSYFRS